MNKIVLGFSGSLRKDALSLKLLNAFAKSAPKNIDFRLADISKLPIYNQDLELPEPEYLLDLKEQLKPADGVLFVTPEYNRSIPPVLKNALDWVSRPQMPVGKGPWGGKVAGIAGVSPYSLGAFGASHHLRQVLTFLNMPTMQQPEFYLQMAGDKFNEKGELTDQTTEQHIDDFWQAFEEFMDKIRS